MKSTILVLVFVVMTVATVAAKNYYITDAGALADDEISDSPALKDIIGQAKYERTQATDHAYIFFGPGKWILDQTHQFVADSRGTCMNYTLDGMNGTILVRGWRTPFQFTGCENVNLKNFIFDVETLPFTGGTIIDSNTVDKTITVKVVAPHPALTNPVKAIITYDTVRDRFQNVDLPTTGNLDFYQRDNTQVSTLVGTDTLIIPVASTTIGSAFHNTTVVLRYTITDKHCLVLNNSYRVTLTNIVIYSCAGMGVVSGSTRDLTIDGLHINKTNGRWMSTTADGTHLNNVRGIVTIKNSFYEGMGDDAINIHNEIGRVSSKTDTAIGIVHGKYAAWFPIAQIYPGDVLAFGTETNPFNSYSLRDVDTVEQIANETWVTFKPGQTMPTSLMVGHVVIVRSIATATITNVHIQKNRARGILVNAKKVSVQGCHISETTGPGLLMDIGTNDWWEGNAASNLVVTDNVFTENNYGKTSAGKSTGSVVFKATIGQTTPETFAQHGAFQYASFYGNRFNGPFAQNIMSVTSVRHMHIEGNIFENHLLVGPYTIISMCASSNVTAQLNFKTSTVDNVSGSACSVANTAPINLPGSWTPISP